MPKLKLQGEGWLSLPVEFRRKLRLQSGDELEAEVVGGAIRLRVVGRTQSSLWPQEDEVTVDVAPTPAAIPPEPEPSPAPEPPSPAPKRRGRPPKALGTRAPIEEEAAPAAIPPAASVPLPASEPPSVAPKRRGRPPKAKERPA